MSVLARPPAPTHLLPGAAFTSLATPSRGSADTAVWEVRLTPGHPGTPHRLTRQEVFIILSGRGQADIDDVPHDLHVGDALVVPAHTSFGLQAVGNDDLVALCCMPVGGQALMEDDKPFTPPWAQ